MAAAFLLSLGFLLSLLQSSGSQTIIGLSSSFADQDPPIDPSPNPTKQTELLWPSLPARGRSDVPIRPTVKNKLTIAGQQGQGHPRPKAQSPPSFISVLATHNLSSGPLITQPPSSRARTDTARLAFRGHTAKLDPTSKGVTPPQPTLSSSTRVEEAVRDVANDILQDLGSGNFPTVEETPVHLPHLAQYQPPAQTTISLVSDLKPPAEYQTLRPHLFPLTPVNKISTTSPGEVRTTAPPVAAQTTSRAVHLSGK